VRIVCAIAIASSASSAAAQEAEREQPIQELFIGETVYVQDKKEIQLTSSFDYGKNGEKRTWRASQAMQYGITDRLEVDAALPMVPPAGSTSLCQAGVGDAEIGVLYGLRRRIESLAVSAGLRFRTPSGSEQLGRGEGEKVVEPVLIVARAWGSAELHVSGEIGYANHGSPREWTYGAGAVVPAGHWRLTLELDGRNDEGEKRLLLTPGLYHKRSRHLEVGVAVPIGLTPEATDLGALARLTLEFGGQRHRSPGE
jgi:hypothetical protein